VEPYDILKVKNALVKCMYCVTECNICRQMYQAIRPVTDSYPLFDLE